MATRAGRGAGAGNGGAARKKSVTAAARDGARASPAAAARGEALLALIARRKARIVEDFYDIGEALREIVRRKLYAALGYGSFDELLKARGVMGAAQAHKLIAVVEHVPRERALRLGQEKSYALVAYAAATPELDSPEILLERGAKVAGKLLADASVRELKGAARAARAKAKPATAAAQAKARRARDGERKLRAALRAVGLRAAKVELVGQTLRVSVPVEDAAALPKPEP